MPDNVSFVNGRTFDRVPEASRNAAYPIRGLIQPAELERTRIQWGTGPVLDQGPDGACVGFGWTQEALSSPVRVNLQGIVLPKSFPREPTAFAKRLYWAIQRHDEWAGGSYPDAKVFYEGTSVVAGARQMVRLGLLREYRWAETTDEIRDSLLSVGPVVLGVSWRENMFEPDAHGFISATGGVAGGHCVLLTGYQPDKQSAGGPAPAFEVTNSWGSEWAVEGKAWLTEPDLASLMADYGEACVPVARSYGEKLPLGERLKNSWAVTMERGRRESRRRRYERRPEGT